MLQLVFPTTIPTPIVALFPFPLHLLLTSPSHIGPLRDLVVLTLRAFLPSPTGSPSGALTIPKFVPSGGSMVARVEPPSFLIETFHFPLFPSPGPPQGALHRFLQQRVARCPRALPRWATPLGWPRGEYGRTVDHLLNILWGHPRATSFVPGRPSVGFHVRAFLVRPP